MEVDGHPLPDRQTAGGAAHVDAAAAAAADRLVSDNGGVHRSSRSKDR